MSTPYWQVAVVKKVANGWMVTPTGEAAANPWVEAVYVFNSWVECAEFLQLVTTKPEGVPVLTEEVKP